jgi:hypothetical protein
MAASYPTSAKTFTTKATNDSIEASHVNDLQDEVTAVETALIDTLQHGLKFTDATYDIGASGATRPRDLFLSRNLVVGGTIAPVGALTVGDLRGTEETITATGTVNDQALGAATTILRCNNASLLTLTGFTGGAAGRLLIVYKAGAGLVEFDHQTGSAAANQLVNFATVGNTPLSTNGYAMYRYDGTLSRWVLLVHEQGAWITRTFAAGNYTAGTGTWTVASASRDAFKLSGNELTFSFVGTGTTNNGANLSCKILLPGAFTALSSDITPVYISANGAGVSETGFCQSVATQLVIARNGSVAIAAGTFTAFGVAKVEVT